jgi:TnpA family transposase
LHQAHAAHPQLEDLTFFRPKDAKYRHIDALFSDTVDSELIEPHWQELLQVVLSFKAGVVSSALAPQAPHVQPPKPALLGVQRGGPGDPDIFLLEYLSSAEMREQITATTNKVEAYHRFSKWLFSAAKACY